MADKREQLLDIMQDAAKCETKEALRAEIAALKAENETLREDNKVLQTEACRAWGLLKETAERALAERAARHPDAYRVHAPEDDYYGTGGDKLQFHPLTPSQIEYGETATPLYALTTEPATPEGEQEAVAWPKIMYVCEYCQEHNPEMCGHDRTDLYVTPEGRWLCDGCREEEGLSHSKCVSPPKLYTRPAEQAVTEAIIDKAVIEAIQALRLEQPGRAYDILKAAMEAGR